MIIKHTIIAGFRVRTRKKVIIHSFSRTETSKSKADAILINYGFIRPGVNPDTSRLLDNFKEITGSVEKVNEEFEILYQRLLRDGYEMSVISRGDTYSDFDDLKSRLPVPLFISVGKNILSALFPDTDFSAMQPPKRSAKGVFGETQLSPTQERYQEMMKLKIEEEKIQKAFEAERRAAEQLKAEEMQRKALESIEIYGAF